MAMFHLLKIRTSIDIFKNEKCKVTFGLEYISNLIIFRSGYAHGRTFSIYEGHPVNRGNSFIIRM